MTREWDHGNKDVGPNHAMIPGINTLKRLIAECAGITSFYPHTSMYGTFTALAMIREHAVCVRNKRYSVIQRDAVLLYMYGVRAQKRIFPSK